jgi:hypothetical protein
MRPCRQNDAAIEIAPQAGRPAPKKRVARGAFRQRRGRLVQRAGGEVGVPPDAGGGRQAFEFAWCPTAVVGLAAKGCPLSGPRADEARRSVGAPLGRRLERAATAPLKRLLAPPRRRRDGLQFEKLPDRAAADAGRAVRPDEPTRPEGPAARQLRDRFLVRQGPTVLPGTTPVSGAPHRLPGSSLQGARLASRILPLESDGHRRHDTRAEPLQLRVCPGCEHSSGAAKGDGA